MWKDIFHFMYKKIDLSKQGIEFAGGITCFPHLKFGFDILWLFQLL